jgi:mannitol-1-phosphate 5-dehydrogenase
MNHTFVGFGFGPIQSGLFLLEAYRSGNFGRLVVAEVMPDVVRALRQNKGRYRVNVATRNGITVQEVEGIEIYNPLERTDRAALVAALAEAQEIGTALPSIDFYDRGEASVARLLSEAFECRLQANTVKPVVVYTAENHNHAAEALEMAVATRLPASYVPDARRHIQYLNTVIGKMSGVVTDAGQIADDELTTLVDGWERAVLVEEFNRILVTRINLLGFMRGLQVFLEKDDLIPFEEAKLYGHNATHALIGYLAHEKGYAFMSNVASDQPLLTLAREAFIEESGRALIARFSGLDPLFSPAGYTAYADDLLDRMMNPFLKDQVARVIRDPRRKLAWDDRLIGTMRLALDTDLMPTRFARGAEAALTLLCREKPGQSPADVLDQLWRNEPDSPPGRKAKLKGLILRTPMG